MADYSIRDIARMAGVSVGTVSRILNNAENVDEGIRRRTMEVIRQVNYRSGRARQARRTARHGAVGSGTDPQHRAHLSRHGLRLEKQ